MIKELKAKSSKLKAGFSTLEILVAFTVLILSITAVMGVVFGNQSISVDTQTNNEALYKGQEFLENARATAKLDFNLVNPIPVILDDIYSKSLDVSYIDLFTKKVISNVSWRTDSRTQSIALTTLLTNPIHGDDTCGSVLVGDWTNPQMSSPIDVGNTPSGNPVTSINVFEGKMYITTDNTHGQNNDFYIYDTSVDPKNPTIVGSLDGIDANGKKSGLNSVAISKNGSNKYAYVANAHDADFSTCAQGPACSQMRIIDVTDPAFPVLGQSYKLPFVEGSSGQAIGNTIFYKDGYVYLGLSKTLTGPEFNIIDVHDPSSPFLVGSYPVGRGVNAIRVRNNYAYLTVDDNSKEIIVLDVSVPTTPTPVVGIYDALPDNTGFGYGAGLNLVGDRIYMGRTYISNAPEFLILNNSNPAAIPSVPLGSIDIGPVSNPQSLYGVVVRDYLAFLTTGNKSSGTGYFQIWNISNLSSMFLVKSFDISAIVHSGSIGSSSDCEGNYIYVGSYRISNDKGVILVVYPS